MASTDACGVAGRHLQQAEEHGLVVDDERRHAPDGVRVDVRGVLLLDRRQRLPGVDLGAHGVGVDTGGGEHGRQLVPVLQLPGGDVAVLEQRVVDGVELLRMAVAHGDRRLQGEQPGVVVGPLPHRWLTLGDVRLTERERQERDLPVGACPQPGEDVLVGDAGVRAPVVVGQSEVAGHGAQRRQRQRIPSRRRTRPAPTPSAAPTAMPATTSEAWWMRTYARLAATTDASVHHSGADRRPSHPSAPRR